ncbi:hypothetical protein AWC29_20135 [Mycobacterium triplex]|uniref:Uncharacterized protein n=1 Tax=Mycobacterium triplex TaxID=47839 RepID=A0A024JYG3_9MYCO|nr:hypothetical protein [Mycobacterium triplex]ORX02170.1 hypothetical protein AWC29_20135 [Mycobacterium triplex]CDO88392.1 hypothetical protein BN973_02757 [Mycobacterium triplex]
MCSSHVGSAAIDISELQQQVAAWSAHPALAELVGLFGGAVPDGLSLRDRLAFLDEFSDAWDYRGLARAATAERLSSQDAAGAARWLIPRLTLPAEQLDRIAAATAALGVTNETMPAGTDFDYILVIGGARYTNLLRARYAREMADGRRIGHVVLAAASRPVLDSEQDAIDACAPGARTEFELMTAGAADAFGLDTRELVEHTRRRVGRPQSDETVWRFAPDSNELGVPITLLETPSPDPHRRRANSADTYTFAARTVGMAGSSCLMVTGQPVGHYLHFEALRSLAVPFGIRVESASFGVERYNRLGDKDEQHPAKVLQEVRSAIRSARGLVEQLTP